IHARQPADGLHIADIVVDHQVTPLDQLDPHLLRQKAVFEVRAVIDPWRQQDHGWISIPARRQAPQDLDQFQRILVDRQDLAGLENLREGPRHYQPVLQHIRDTARRPDIVLEYQVIAGLGIPYQVDTGDVRIDAPRHLDP